MRESPASLPQAGQGSGPVREQIGQQLGPSSRQSRVIRWVRREIRDRDYRGDAAIELVRTQIPVRVFRIVARDPRIEGNARQSRVG
jgi:hypothetical protein